MAWRRAQQFVFVGGLLAMGFTAYNYAARYFWQSYKSYQFDRSLAMHTADARRPLATTVDYWGSGYSSGSPGSAVTQRSLIGRITIPRLSISAIVEEGTNAETLDLAVGHISSTALPGQQGNVGVAAHRDTLFRRLQDVHRDDAIRMTTLDGTYVYRVVSFRVVGPTDVSVLAATAGEKTLTLVTCYPFHFVGHAPRRFVVRALQIN